MDGSPDTCYGGDFMGVIRKNIDQAAKYMSDAAMPATIIGAGTEDQPLSHTFRRGEGFPFWTLCCLHRGAIRTRSRGRETVVRAGDFSAVRPGTPYDIRLE